MVSKPPASALRAVYPPHPRPRPAPAQPFSPISLPRVLSHTMLPGCGGGVAGRQRCVLPSHCGLTCNGSHPALNVGMASPSLPLPPGRPAAGLRSTCDPQCDAPSLPSDLAACARESFRRTGTTFTMGRCDKGASKPLALALRAGHPPTPSLLFLLRSQMSLGRGARLCLHPHDPMPAHTIASTHPPCLPACLASQTIPPVGTRHAGGAVVVCGGAGRPAVRTRPSHYHRHQPRRGSARNHGDFNQQATAPVHTFV